MLSDLPEPRRSLPVRAERNIQYDLFTTFFGKNKHALSNTIELWDAIPKYAVSPRLQNVRRDGNGRLPVHSQEFEYRPSHRDTPAITCRLKVQPAAIEVEPGRFVDFYPSTDEELIEEIILLPIKPGGHGTEYTVADTKGGQPCTDGNGMPKPKR
jgi:hypothetical protein